MSNTWLLQHSKLNCSVWQRAFARLQIELYCVELTMIESGLLNFKKDCMFEICVISLLRRLMIMSLI